MKELRYKLVSLIIGLMTLCGLTQVRAEAIDELALRVTEGTSAGKIVFEVIENDGADDKDWFEISATADSLVKIEGNNAISLAVGLNTYLKDFANIHISWNNLTEKLPDILVLPAETVRGETDLKQRYYLNYCTFSYSMAFWDEERWMKELDWMALHGINLALSMTGIESVWKNVLKGYGYTQDEISAFVPGPAYMAWWQMGNLEGWGGPLTEEWFNGQEQLEKSIVNRMRELGIEPVFPGYSGMVPKSFEEITGNKVVQTGLWCGFNRPALIYDDEELFAEMAERYYTELERLYGKTKYYSMDPFHEGGNIEKVDLRKIGGMIYDAMKASNADGVWVIQGWQGNPRNEILDTIPPGDLLVLDLYSEKVPKWKSEGVYGNHYWLYCMLLNFGGNVGMHGRIKSLTDGFAEASDKTHYPQMKGIGATPEGIENNEVMFELLFDLPWKGDSLNMDNWLKDYLTARYGKTPSEDVVKAWQLLCNTVYNAPTDYRGEGTVESIICARPTWHPQSASTWGSSKLFYSADSTALAARLMEGAKNEFGNSKNFLYDLIDISRQANADRANGLINAVSRLYQDGKTDSARAVSNEFLSLIQQQDSLLSILPETHADTWLNAAESLGETDEARKLYRKNAAMLITVWGDSIASNRGGLHDYSHREWGGITGELYYERWKAFFNHQFDGAPFPDFYKMELDWARSKSED